jgi:predicted  nucleic acid-binding Zn-ribbon protein
MKTSENTQALIEILNNLSDELADINEIQSAIAKIASASDSRIQSVKATMEQINESLRNVVENNTTTTYLNEDK